MKFIFLLIFVFFYRFSFCQKSGDNTICVTVNDTNNIYNRIKWAFINLDFIVKDLDIPDTLKTYPREFLNNDFLVATAIINNNKIKINGLWFPRKLTFLGYTTISKEVERVYYYKGSVEFNILKSVAEFIGGKIEKGWLFIRPFSNDLRNVPLILSENFNNCSLIQKFRVKYTKIFDQEPLFQKFRKN